MFTCGDVDLRDQYVAVDGEGVADVIQDAPQFLYHCNICGLQLDSSQVLIDHWRTCSENRCIMGKYPFQIHSVRTGVFDVCQEANSFQSPTC